MNELELNSLEQCIAHRDAMGGVYLDTCLGERMFVWFNEHPSFAPNLLLVLALLLIIPLLGQGIIKAWQIAKKMKLKEAFYDVANGVMFTGGVGFLVLLATGLIFANQAVQTNNAELFAVSIFGMALFAITWFALFCILNLIMNVILLLLATRGYLRERQEKKKNYLSDGSDGTEGRAS